MSDGNFLRRGEGRRLCRVLERFDHIDFFVLPRDHPADQQGNAEGQRDEPDQSQHHRFGRHRFQKTAWLQHEETGEGAGGQKAVAEAEEALRAQLEAEKAEAVAKAAEEAAAKAAEEAAAKAVEQAAAKAAKPSTPEKGKKGKHDTNGGEA